MAYSSTHLCLKILLNIIYLVYKFQVTFSESHRITHHISFAMTLGNYISDI